MNPRPNHPGGIPGHPYEPRKDKLAGCAYCGKAETHPTHAGPFIQKKESEL